MYKTDAPIVPIPRRCLLVDDHLEARRWMKEAIHGAFAGVEVLEGDCLEEGRLLLNENIDLALLDIGLPDGSGIDLVAPLVLRSCDVVMATVLDDDDHLFNALQQGATGYILKEEPQSELIEMLTGIVEGRPPLSPNIARRILRYFSEQNQSGAAPDTTTPTVEFVKQDPLTTRERDVLTLLAKGYTVKDVAGLLDIGVYTAAGYAKSVYRKLNVSSRAEATLEATRRGYVSP